MVNFFDLIFQAVHGVSLAVDVFTIYYLSISVRGLHQLDWETTELKHFKNTFYFIENPLRTCHVSSRCETDRWEEERHSFAEVSDRVENAHSSNFNRLLYEQQQRVQGMRVEHAPSELREKKRETAVSVHALNGCRECTI